MSRQPPADRRRDPGVLPIALVLLILFAAYVLSYPPALGRVPERMLVIYRPVEWLIDNTPLRTPMYWWDRFCGEDFLVTVRAMERLIDRLNSESNVRP